jgi:hypothetical protein
MERQYMRARGAAVCSIANFMDSRANRMISPPTPHPPHVLTLRLCNQICTVDMSVIQDYGWTFFIPESEWILLYSKYNNITLTE